MEDVKWLEVTLDTTEAELDALCARLTGNGVTGLAIEDEEDFKTFLEQNHQYWDYVDDGLLARMKGVCRVKFYITDDADGRKQLEGWLAGIDQPYSLASLGDNDWAYSWQKYYKPMPVGERLYIVPEWERGEPVPAGKAPLYLNPGLTFGTGSHASTQLCLMGLERYTVPGKPVLDLGCGSGILSIAALVLGASAAAAVDIDPKAVDVAYECRPQRHRAGPLYRAGGQCPHRRGPGGRAGPAEVRPGAGQHRGRRDHTPVRPGGGIPGHGRGVPVLRHHRHPGRRGGGRPGAEWPGRV